jgi:coproporphyrinogen III oxidase-like Fe-S oxidoreductase
VGVQSFDDTLLREMGRFEKYGGEETAGRIRAAAGIFPTLNVDLIFNQPHQTLASLERDLEIFPALGVDLISYYPLMSSPPVGSPPPRRGVSRATAQAAAEHTAEWQATPAYKVRPNP